MNQQNRPDSDSAWEEAMSRDFDARVRDLHEAPLDFTSVKGRARTIRRNRRAAVAGGILGVAAVITPIAVLTNGGDPQSREPDFAENSETASDPADGLDYVVGRTWHQADGDQVRLPSNDYSSAVIWDDQLVATRYDGEAYYDADVIDDEGNVVRSFETTAPVVANAEGTTIAWVDTEGQVMTAWDGDEVSIGSVNLSSAGEGVPWWASTVSGGPDCNEEAGSCTVHLVSGMGAVESFDSHGVNDSPLEQFNGVKDVQDQQATVLTDIADAETCSALVDVGTGASVFETCTHQLWQISPDGRSIAAPPSYFDGNGPTSISILDVEGTETGIYSPEGGFIGTWAWSTDSRLIFDAYDGAQWHLFAMTTDGAITEIGEPVKADEFSSPFTLIQH